MSSLFGIGGGGNVGAAGGFYSYSIDQSLRFNDGDSPFLKRDITTTSNAKTWTWSAWVKRSSVSTRGFLFSDGKSSAISELEFQSNGTLYAQVFDGSAGRYKVSTQVFRDASAWYHIVWRVDTTQATAADRNRVYINGEQITDWSTENHPTQNADTTINVSGNDHIVGAYSTGSNNFDGYMAEVHFVDGTSLDATSFGETINGIWVPKQYSGSYGTNGFYLSFADSAAIGDDLSGNTNDFTANNLAASDVVPDSPTLNHSTIVPMANTSLSEGNLRLTTSRTGNWDGTIGSFGVSSGKWYYEAIMSHTEPAPRCAVGWIGNPSIQTASLNGVGYAGDNTNILFDQYLQMNFNNGAASFQKDGAYHGTSTAPVSGDIVSVAVDLDAGKIWFGINGTYIANDGGTDGDPANGTNESITGMDLTASEYVPFFMVRSDNTIGGNVIVVNFGQDSTFAGGTTAGGNSDENGYGDFKYSVPSGFLALVSANLPEPAIGPNSTTTSDEHFNTVLYTGTGVARSITGVNFQSDFSWFKERSSTSGHLLFDSVRGAGKSINSDSTAAEFTSAVTLTSFDSDGFSLGTSTGLNQSGVTNVAWNWKAGGTAVSNTDGSITSQVSANPDAGFSIVSYTGTGASDDYGHGLGVAPNMIITKDRTNSAHWAVYVSDIGTGKYLELDRTIAVTTAAAIYPSVSSTTIGVGVQGGGSITNTSGDNYISYCFANVDGFSKVGSYVGNGSADGPYVALGFKPALVITKGVTSTSGWNLRDNKRSPENVVNEALQADTTGAELTSGYDVDFLSNGFKLRTSLSDSNTSGQTYIYLAFAEAPAKYSNAR